MVSPWLTTQEIAELLKFTDHTGAVSPRAALAWLDRYRIPTKRRGRIILAHVDDVMAKVSDRRRPEVTRTTPGELVLVPSSSRRRRA